MTLALGIDVGTSGVRTAVVDESGMPVSSAKTGHPAQVGNDIDATLWWQAVETCLRLQIVALSEKGIDPKDIGSIAVDGTSGSMVLTDAELSPVSPALMYNSKGFDAEAAKIAQHAPDPHIARGSNSALARAMRLLASATVRPAHLLHQADYITSKLLGQGAHSDDNNALKTGYDPQDGAWPEWIGAVFPPELLPECHPVGMEIGAIDALLARRLGLSSSTIIVAGTTDSAAAFVACAPFQDGVAVTSLGSTMAVKVLSRNRIVDPKIGLYSHKLGEHWLVGGASNTGGAVLAHFFSNDELARLSREIDPEKPTDLDYYPLLRPGERFPINDPEFEGRMSPRPSDDAEFLAGLLEGVSRVEAKCYREIERRGGDFPSQVFSAGGGAANETFRAIRARNLGVPVRVSSTNDAAIGSARIATWWKGAKA